MNSKMKTRIITAVVGLVVVVLALIFINTVFFNLLAAFFSVMICLEITNANKVFQNKPLLVLNILLSAGLPFVPYAVDEVLYAVIVSYIILFMGIIILGHDFQNLTKNITVAAEIMLYSFSFYSIAVLRDFHLFADNSALVKPDGLYFIMLAMAMAWGSDSGAYFAGSFLGKRRLAPHVSGGKTVEGFVGGLLSSLLICVVVSFFYKLLCPYEIASMNYIAIIIIAVVGSAVGVIGDLFASCIKRAGGLKDSGNFFPGHGGVLDRFDSLATIALFLNIVLRFVDLIQRF